METKEINLLNSITFMSEIKQQLTVEQAADRYANSNYMYPNSMYAESAFKAGAEWQKEQFKELLEAAESALNYLNTKYPKEADILHNLKNAIEKTSL